MIPRWPGTRYHGHPRRGQRHAGHHLPAPRGRGPATARLPRPAASAAPYGSASTMPTHPPNRPSAGSSAPLCPPPTSPPRRSPLRHLLDSGLAGQTHCGWDWTPTRAAPGATRAAGPPAASSPSARHCADAGTRRRPSRRSATRPPCSPVTCSSHGRTQVPAAPHSQSIAEPAPGLITGVIVEPSELVAALSAHRAVAGAR